MKIRYVPIRLFIIFLVLAAVVLKVTYQRSNAATKVVREGDIYVQNNQASLALEKYSEAVELMPLIVYTPSYKRRVAYAESLVEFSSNPDVVIFLKDNVTQEDIDAFVEEIRVLSGFKNLVFLTKEEAQDKYEKKITGVNVDELFSVISSDDLFLSVEIYLEDSRISDSIIKLAETKDFVYLAFKVE